MTAISYIGLKQNAPAHRMNGEQGLTNQPEYEVKMAESKVRNNAIRICEVEGCERLFVARGLCRTHYARWRRKGCVRAHDPIKNQFRGSPEERFLHYVEKSNSCWIWTGGIAQNGYGRFSQAGETMYAHRWSYENFVSPIPTGLQIDHLCRNRSCVNPRHLEPVTPAENIRRGETGIANSQKTHCSKGHPYHGENLTMYKGKRRCRACHRDLERHRRALQKQRENENSCSLV